MFIKIDDIPLGDLPSEQEEWVESKIGSDYFVAISDGDWSPDYYALPLDVIVEKFPKAHIVCDINSTEVERLRMLGYVEFAVYHAEQWIFRKVE